MSILSSTHSGIYGSKISEPMLIKFGWNKETNKYTYWYRKVVNNIGTIIYAREVDGKVHFYIQYIKPSDSHYYTTSIEDNDYPIQKDITEWTYKEFKQYDDYIEYSTALRRKISKYRMLIDDGISTTEEEINGVCTIIDVPIAKINLKRELNTAFMKLYDDIIKPKQ